MSSAVQLLWASTVLATGDVAALSAHNQSLLWGPYRPNLYFGVRPRIPDGILTGLLWSNVEDYNTVQTSKHPPAPRPRLTRPDFRYTCEQNEGMTGYGWDKYDPRSGGIQTIHDAVNEIDLTTSFVKVSDAGDKGGNWAVRVKGAPRGGRADIKTTVVFSVTSPGSGLQGLEVAGDLDYLRDPRGIEGDVTLKGENPTLGPFKMVITERAGKHPSHGHPSQDDRPLDRSQVASATLPENVLWQTKRKNLAFLGLC
jgi:mannosyl-oligosaccharide glucosidase